MIEEYIILLADIHANDTALAAVIQDAFARYNGRLLRFWFLGDLFGRGPDPELAWDRLMKLKPEASVVGNHDWFITQHTEKDKCVNTYENDTDRPPHYIGVNVNHDDCWVWEQHRATVLMMEKKLWLNGSNQFQIGSAEAYINHLPVVHVPRPGIFLVHGGLEVKKHKLSPPNPAVEPDTYWSDHWRKFAWGYVKKRDDAQLTIKVMQWLHQYRPSNPNLFIEKAAFASWQQPGLIIVGHWHVRRLFENGDFTNINLDTEYRLMTMAEKPTLISPGSVGFPNGDNRACNACYALLKLQNGIPNTVTFHAVEFDRAAVRTRMKNKNYPHDLINRLCRPGETI
ncbi:MAG: metallophosphatase family protein [Anaerolineales bacterium]|nr:metallophosphatase family protein [Anaerolineales bacterium]